MVKSLLFLALALILCTSAMGQASAESLKAKPAVPELRFRVLYKATNAPVQWLFVDISCERKLGWSERRKTGQEQQKTYSSFGFYPTKDGWVTLPAIEAPGTTE